MLSRRESYLVAPLKTKAVGLCLEDLPIDDECLVVRRSLNAMSARCPWQQCSTTAAARHNGCDCSGFTVIYVDHFSRADDNVGDWQPDRSCHRIDVIDLPKRAVLKLDDLAVAFYSLNPMAGLTSQ